MRIYFFFAAMICGICSFAQNITVSGPTNLCQGESVTLTAPAGASWVWSNNSTVIPGATSQTYIATTSGSYSVSYITGGVPQTADPVVVNVRPLPVPTFTFTNNACSGTAVNFTSNVSVGTAPYTYSWDFGDGNTSTAANPSHVFTSLGCATQNFPVTLKVTDANGCSATVSHTVTIKQAPAVELQDQDIFSPFSNCDNNPSSGNASFSLTVNNVSPNASCITTYTLNWGDGTIENGLTSASFPRSHTYTQLGAFDLVVTANGANGCISQKSYPVANQVEPNASLGTTGQLSGCESVPVQLEIGNWTQNSPGTKYRLDFGDGTFQEFTHPINATNSTEIILHTYTASSCINGSIKPILTTTNYCKTTQIVGPEILVYKKPQPDFSTSPTPGCVGQPLSFTNQTIAGYFLNCLRTTTYLWDFGDGTTSTLANPPPHIYTAAGTYTVTLTATNGCGSNTITKQVCITPKPTAGFTLDNLATCTGSTINATNTSVKSTCGVTNYSWTVAYASGFCGTSSSWSFANGTNANSETPSFTFLNPGTYTITLTVNSPCGNTTSQQIVKVKQKPTVVLPAIPDACDIVNYTPQPTITGCGESPLTYAWLFDGAPSGNANSATPGTIAFTTPGVHTVSLAVTNECGTTTVTKQFTISSSANLSIPASTAFCNGENTGNLNISSTTPGATITWTNNNPSIGLAASGSGSINSFVATNTGTTPRIAVITVTAISNSCSAQSTFTITVNPTPQAPGVSVVNYCQGDAATPLNAMAAPGHTLSWFTSASGGTGSSTAPTPLTTSTGSTSYYVSQINNTTNCESSRAMITVNVHPVPVISGSSFTAPLNCASTTGTITLEGLAASRIYTVQYTLNGSPVSINIISNASGAVLISALGAGTYDNIRVVSNGCTSNSVGPYTLTDPNPPATPTTSTNAPFCEGGSLSLNAISATPGVSYAWTGPNGFTSSLQNPVINPAGANVSGSYNVIATLNNCKSAPAPLSVLIHPRPATPTTVNAVTICAGEVINLTSGTSFPGAVTYSWTGPNGFSSTDQNPSIVSSTTAMSGNYTVTVTSITGSCTSPAASVPVTVNPIPSISGSSFTNPTNCGSSTGTITLNGLFPSTSYIVRYLKNGNPLTATIVSTANGNLVITGLTAGAYTNIYVTLAGCMSNTIASVTLADPNPPPAPTVSTTAPVCQGESFQLNVTSLAGAVYSWTGPNSFVSTQQNPVINGAPLAAAGTYNVIATLNNCPSPAAPVNVVIHPRPLAPTLPATVTTCLNETIRLTSSSAFAGALSYAWTGPNGFTSNVQNPEIPNATPAMAGTYSLTITSVTGSCASPSASLNVVILPLPNISSSSHINPIGCGTATGSIILNGLMANQVYTVFYRKNAGAIVTETVTANNAGSLIISGMTAGVYTDVMVSRNGCNSNIAGPFLLTDTAPFSVMASTNAPLCEGTTVLLNADVTASGGATYEWNGPNGFTSTIKSPVIPNGNVTHNGIYYAAVTIDGCTANDSITVTVSERTIAGNTSANATVCRGKNDGTVYLSGQFGQVVRWETSINNGASWMPVQNSALFIRYKDLMVTTWYRALVQNGACPGLYSGITMINVLNTVENVSFTPNDLGTCVRDTTIRLTAAYNYTGSDPVSFYWYVNGQIRSTTNPFNLEIRVPANSTLSDVTTIRVLAENSFGCGDTSAAGKITVFPTPQLVKTKDNDINCKLAISHISVSGASTYLWRSTDAAVNGATTPALTVTPANTSTYYVLATSADGCQARDSIQVVVDRSIGDGSFELPNAFTPNGDGKNDCFGAKAWGNVSNFRLSIFNRRGQLMFTTTNPNDCWDGTYNGKPQAPDAYVYWIEAKTICEERAFRKGTVILIR
jgi:gliding motility-associated-like protein